MFFFLRYDQNIVETNCCCCNMKQLKGWDCRDGEQPFNYAPSSPNKKHSPPASKTWSHFNYAPATGAKAVKMFFGKNNILWRRTWATNAKTEIEKKNFLAPSKRKGRKCWKDEYLLLLSLKCFFVPFCFYKVVFPS